MRVTATIAWWNEKPEDLVSCIRGASNLADRIVAVDGSYRRFPNGTPKSSDEEVEAIKDTCKDLGVECKIFQPWRLWAGAIEKRSYMFAMVDGTPDDWVLILDADHILTTNYSEAHRALSTYGPDVDRVTMPITTPLNEKREIIDSSATDWHVRMAGTTYQNCCLIRRLEGLRVERYHWWYSGIKKDKRVWIPYGGITGSKIYPELGVYEFGVGAIVEHRSLFRTKKQVLAARAFYNDRAMVVAKTGQEDDVPGLPAPSWNYETLPFKLDTWMPPKEDAKYMLVEEA